jgi:hypothetical protein
MTSINSFSRAERLYSVYAAYGEAILMAHSLEKHLAALLTCHATDLKLSKLEMARELEKVSKMTMGQLAAKFCEIFNPDENVREELGNMLYFRNDLTHRISNSMLFAARERDWDTKLLQELSEIAQMFVETRQLLKPYSEKWLAENQINMNEMVLKLLAFYPGISKRAANC